MRVLNSAQMREADRRTIEEIGISSLVLMENAGRQAVAAMEAVYADLAERHVAVLCGRGSNGGDGFVIARTLIQRGIEVSVFVIGRVADVRGDARTNLEILGRLGVTVVADVNASGIPVVAIDLPSGLSADSSEPIGDSVEASMTVTLAAPKLPLVLPPAETRAGDIVTADIGIPADVIDSVTGPRVELLTRGSMRELIAPRAPDSHKGDFGRVLVIAGSRGKTGAAHLAGMGALRSGAGLVTIATPACCLPIG